MVDPVDEGGGSTGEEYLSVGLGPVDHSRVDCGEITPLQLTRILEDGSSPNCYYYVVQRQMI